LKKNSQENSKDLKNTQTKNSNKASEAKHKEYEHNNEETPATVCIFTKLCTKQQQRFKKKQENEAQQAPGLGPMTMPHDDAAASEG